MKSKSKNVEKLLIWPKVYFKIPSQHSIFNLKFYCQNSKFHLNINFPAQLLGPDGKVVCEKQDSNSK